MLKRFISKSCGMLFYMVQYGCIAHCTLEFVADFVVCSGPSMQPTIHTNDVVLTEHISIHKRRVQKGDVVIAHSVSDPEQFVCKRVVAMEGDRVYNSTSHSYKYIPRGHVWLEGDNKDNSTDSRVYGPVPYGLLRGRVFFKIWPLTDMGSLKIPGQVKS